MLRKSHEHILETVAVRSYATKHHLYMTPAIVLAAWLVVQTAPRLHPSDLMLRSKSHHLCLVSQVGQLK